MRAGEWGLFIVLVLVGIYFLVFHTDPLPANHEDIGLGNLHILHDIIGIALIGVGVWIWRHSRRISRPSMPA